MLDARLAERRGAFALDVILTAEPGATTALVGESGAGKTSVLRLLAGLDRPDRGRITVDGIVYADAARGIHLPPYRRSVGYVPQDFALFPHLTAAANVAFGLQALGWSRAARRARAREALDAAGVVALADRLPHQLSGGQQQRVALARALALEPRLLLLDEPLAALDLQTRRLVRGELRSLLARLACITVYVTHSPVEALVFGDRIVVLEAGRVSQAGPREELLRRPRTPFVAELMGTNLLAGRPATDERITAGVVRTADGPVAVGMKAFEAEVLLTVSPREITLFREPPAGSAQNVFAGTIEELVPEPPAGERVRVMLGTRPPLVAEVTRDAVEALGLAPGLEVYATFKATGVTRYS